MLAEGASWGPKRNTSVNGRSLEGHEGKGKREAGMKKLKVSVWWTMSLL